MSDSDREGETPPPQSLVSRLRRELGRDVDPRISLSSAEDEPTPVGRGGDPSRAAAPSSGLIDRLALRDTTVSSRYRLDGEIARGGMGAILSVWDEDLRRRLAMKVALGTGRDGDSQTAPSSDLDPRILARFLEEAQVTGQLDHPGIVPVHELGIDENGHVYFTMRMVRGEDLATVFDRVARGDEEWTVTRALGVMQKVCEAMAYAHTKGVIHRDLKPANVMVGRFGEVYVMDWGLARVAGHEDRHDVRVAGHGLEDDGPVAPDRRGEPDSGIELYTMDGDVIGTPSYMSPEQARGDLDALDARGDVYAVGAMLYRLLAGTAPYAPPGKRVGASFILSSLMEGPPTPLEELAPQAAPELVAITEKAMSREAVERYPDMGALADDLRAFLENRVVRAHQTGALAEARKWVRRNKALATSIAAGLLALLAGLVASLVLKQKADHSATLAERRREEAVEQRGMAQHNAELALKAEIVAKKRQDEAEAAALEAREQRALAEANAEEAARQERIAWEANSFLIDDVFSAVAANHGGADVTVREVLDLASLRVAGVGLFEPLVEAALRRSFARSYLSLGEPSSARVHAERALEIRTKELGRDHEDTLSSRTDLADIVTESGGAREAEAMYRENLETLLEKFGPEHDGVLANQTNLAVALSYQGRHAETVELLREVLAAHVARYGAEHGETLVVRSNLGLALQETGRLKEAEDELEAVLDAARSLPRSRRKTPTLVSAAGNLAQVYQGRGRYRRAARLFEDVIEDFTEVLGPEHPQTLIAHSNLGTVLLDLGRFDEAAERFEHALTGLEATLGKDNPETLTVRNNLAGTYGDLGQYERELSIRQEVLSDRRRVLGPRHPDTIETLGNLAVTQLELGRFEESARTGSEVLELQRELLGEDHPATLVTLENMGNALYRMGDYEGSTAIAREVWESRERVLGADHPDVAKTIQNLGVITNAAGDPRGAAEWFELSLARSRAALGDDHPRVVQCLIYLGDASMDADDCARAAQCYREAWDRRRATAPDDPETPYLAHQLGYALLRIKAYDEAVPVLAEAVERRRAMHGRAHDYTLTTFGLYAKALLRNDRLDEALDASHEYHDLSLEAFGPNNLHVARARGLLAEVYEKRGEEEKAASWR